MPPTRPLAMRNDEAFREWYMNAVITATCNTREDIRHSVVNHENTGRGHRRFGGDHYDGRTGKSYIRWFNDPVDRRFRRANLRGGYVGQQSKNARQRKNMENKIRETVMRELRGMPREDLEKFLNREDSILIRSMLHDVHQPRLDIEQEATEDLNAMQFHDLETYGYQGNEKTDAWMLAEGVKDIKFDTCFEEDNIF